MAINTFVTVTIDPSNALKPDRKDHRNTGGPAAADGGNVTLAIDNAVITTMTKLLSCLDTALAVYAGKLPP